MRAHPIGIVGLGMASAPHARALRALGERVAVRAAWSPSAARRERFAAEHSLPMAESLEAIVDDPSIETVLLLTPPDARVEIVEALAGAGKHVLSEKPLERTSEAARHIVETCEAAGVRLGVVFQQRYRDASTALAERLASGELGRIETVRLAVPWWRPQSYYDEPGRGSYARDGGGVLITQAIHALDLMLSLAGPVAEVTAIAGTTGLHRMESEDFVAAGLRFASGALGSLTASTASWPGGSESLTIATSKGSARLEGGSLSLHFRDGREEHLGESRGSGGGSDPMAFPHDWHRRLIEDFIDAVESDRAPSVSGRDALAVHALIDALVLSSRERRHVAPARAEPGQP